MCHLYLFTGAKVNFKKQLTLAFGNNCEVYDGTINTSRSRSVPCIALYPCNNATGSWNFFNLRTNKHIHHSNWKKMITTEVIINAVNALTGRVQAQPDPLSPVAAPLCLRIQEQVKDEEDDDGVPDLTPAGDDDDINEDEADDEDDEEQQEVEAPQPQVTCQSARIAGGMKPPERYNLVSKIQEATSRLKEKRPDDKTLEEAKWKAIEAEILQIFVELKALMPVMREDIPEDAEILCSFIFLVKNFLANGDFDKVKGRIVTNGAQQSRVMYPNRSSPTVGIHSIMTCLTMAAQLDNYALAKIDVKGAYLQMEMTGSPVFMKLDKKLMALVISILPHLKHFVTTEGTFYTRLLKALYGCVQSSRLWYEKLVSVLQSLQYQVCPVDPCIMRRVVNNKIYIIVIYVDNLLLLTDRTEAEQLEKELTAEFNL
jgi:hypothetical protein